MAVTLGFCWKSSARLDACRVVEMRHVARQMDRRYFMVFSLSRMGKSDGSLFFTSFKPIVNQHILYYKNGGMSQQ